MPLDYYSGIPISFWPNLNRIPKNLKVKAVLVVLGRIPNINAMPPPRTISLVCCCPNHGLGAGCHLSLRCPLLIWWANWANEPGNKKLVLKCANSHYFHIGDVGYQPNTGSLYTHYKDFLLQVGWVYPRYEELIDPGTNGDQLCVFCMRWRAVFFWKRHHFLIVCHPALEVFFAFRSSDERFPRN